MLLGPFHPGKSLASNALSSTLEYDVQAPPLCGCKVSRASQTPWCISARICGGHNLYNTVWMHFHSVCKLAEYLALPRAWWWVLGHTFLLGRVDYQGLLFPPSIHVNYFIWFQPLVVYGPKYFPPSPSPCWASLYPACNHGTKLCAAYVLFTWIGLAHNALAAV